MQKRLSTMQEKSLILVGALSVAGLCGYLLMKWTRGIPGTIARTLKHSGFQNLIPYVIAQSKLESANYQSDLFKRSNNLFGMKNAETRNQTGFSIAGDEYRHYTTPQDSVNDFLLYLNAVRFPLRVVDANDYAAELNSRGYFETPVDQYAAGLKSWLI